MTVGPGKFKIHEAGYRLGTQAGFMYCSCQAVFLLLWEPSVFACRGVLGYMHPISQSPEQSLTQWSEENVYFSRS